MPLRRIIRTKNIERADNLQPGRVHWHQNHTLLHVSLRIKIRFTHHDSHLAVRMHRPRRPPFSAIDDVLIPIGYDRGLDICGVRGGHIRLCH